MELTAWLGLVTLVVGVPLNAVAIVLLRKKWKQAPHLRVLQERYITAVCIGIMVVTFGLIFVNNDQAIPPLSEVATKLITRVVMAVGAIVPAVGWIRLYPRRPPEANPERRRSDKGRRSTDGKTE